jgi:hypothetical protein
MELVVILQILATILMSTFSTSSGADRLNSTDGSAQVDDVSCVTLTSSDYHCIEKTGRSWPLANTSHNHCYDKLCVGDA